jgi:large subunit ribosomal protein L24
MSIQPRKVRKAQLNMPLHQARKQMASHLNEALLLKYNRRRVTVVVGDEVKVMRGDHHGKTGRVSRVDTKSRRVVIDGITHKKADGTEVALPVHPSNLLIMKLNLEDKRRRARLGETGEPEKSAKPKAEPKTEAKAESKAEAKPKAEVKPAAKAEPKTEAKAESKAEAKPKAEVKPAAKAEAKPKAEGKPAAKAEPKTEAKAEPKAEAKPAKTATKAAKEDSE